MWDFIVAVVAVVGTSDGGAAPSAADGPASVALVAEDQTPTGKFTTATEVKPIMAATRGNWVAVREWEGQDLVYVTHIWAWRCGLVQLELSVNDAAFEPWPLPECHIDTAQPNGITDKDGLPYQAYDLQSVQSLGVRVTYDDLSTDEAQFSRTDILIP